MKAPLLISRINKWGLTRGKLYKAARSATAFGDSTGLREYLVNVKNDFGEEIDVPYEFFDWYTAPEELRHLDARVASEIMSWHNVRLDHQGTAIGEPDGRFELAEIVPAFTSSKEHNTDIFWNLAVDERVEFMRLAHIRGLVHGEYPWFEQLQEIDPVQTAHLALEVHHSQAQANELQRLEINFDELGSLPG